MMVLDRLIIVIALYRDMRWLEIRVFDSRWCHWNYWLIESFWPHYGPGVHWAPNRNEYQEYYLEGKGGRCVGLTTLPLPYADFLEILWSSTSWNSQGLFRPVQGLL